jgi:rhomboid family GlyGly-CTERM serine protease
MPTITTALRRHGIVALAALTAIVIQAAPSAAQVALRYERSAVAAGEWWRLASSHLVHAGWTHLGLNLAALVLLSLLLRPRAVRQQVLLWSITAAGTGLALLGLMPELDWYVGLSGVLHGVAAWWVLDLLRAAPVAGALALLGIAGKLAMDFASGGQGSAALIGVPVIVEAHLY